MDAHPALRTTRADRWTSKGKDHKLPNQTEGSNQKPKKDMGFLDGQTGGTPDPTQGV